MKFLVVVATLVAYSTAAPSYAVHGNAAAHLGHTAVVPAGPAVTHVAESYHQGPAVARTHVEHGIVGHRTVQVGSQPVQVGHEFYVAGQEVHQPSPYSYVAGEAINTQETRPIAPPALPVAAHTAYAIPPAPRNLGPAPADTVTQERILAPVRTHTRITPKRTHIVPEVHVNKVPYEVRVDVPVPVQRDVVVTKRVEKPYTVEVPRAVPVAVPHKVHPVHEVVQTPVVREHTVSVHQPQIAVATHSYSHDAPVAHHGYAAVAPVAHHGYAAGAAVAHHGYAAGAPVAHHGYAAVAPVAHHGYAADAPVAFAHQGYAAAPVTSHGYAAVKVE